MSFAVNQLIGFGAKRAAAGGVVTGTVRSNTLNANDNTGNFTVRMLYAVAGLTAPTNTPTQTRVTFEAAVGFNLGILAAYIGHKAAAGDAFDFATTPVQLLVGGSGSWTVTDSTSQATDWAAFAWDKTSDILISFAVQSGTRNRYLASSTNVTNFTKSGSDASTVDASGYTNNGASIDGINKIEMDGF